MVKNDKKIQSNKPHQNWEHLYLNDPLEKSTNTGVKSIK